jgi:hypothetical protein
MKSQINVLNTITDCMNNFCECFFLQLPHDDQILSQSENSNAKLFFDLKEMHNLGPPLLIKRAIIEHSKHHGKWARSG